MAMTAIVPITITPEAAARIASLGLQRSLEQIIDRACSVLSDLERVQVDLYNRYELGKDPGLCIEIYGRRDYDRGNQEERSLVRRPVTEFPAEVLEQIIVDYHPGTRHAG